MRILEIGAPYFRARWRAQHDVLAYGPHAHCDLRAEAPIVPLHAVLARLPRGWSPDLIVLGDDSRPLGVLGLEDPPCPTVMLSVDAHHHAAWHAPLARAFDVAFVAQRDYLPAFDAASVRWLPLWAPDDLPPPAAAPRWDVSFVGSLDPRFHPERVVFLAAVRTRMALHVDRGDYAPIFTQSRIVLNQTVRGDLNARVFEAMACGALLLTERTGNGLLDLFRDGEDLVTYRRDDTEGVATLAGYYLGNAQRRAQIAERGRERVRARHLESHRARTVLDAAALADGRRRPASRAAGVARAYCALADWARRRAEASAVDREECAIRRERYLMAAAELARGPLEEPDRSAVAGLVALERGELVPALTALARAARHGGRPEDHVARIEALVRSGDVGAAREATATLCERYPDYAVGGELTMTLDELARTCAPAVRV